MNGVIPTIRNLNPGRGELRRFGMILAIAVVAVALVMRGWPPSLLVPGLALVIAAIAMVAPTALRPVHFALMAVSLPIGWVVSRVLLALVFGLLVVPTGLLLQAFRKDPLKRRRESVESYWEPFEENRRHGSMGL